MGLALGWTAFILVALWGPSPPGPELFENDDKVIHLLGFAGLGFLWMFAAGRAVRSAVIVLVIAAVTELGQGYLPWPRTPDWADFGFDLVGGAVGIAVARSVEWAIARREQPGPLA